MTLEKFKKAEEIVHLIEMKQFYIDAWGNSEKHKEEVLKLNKEIDELKKDFSAI